MQKPGWIVVQLAWLGLFASCGQSQDPNALPFTAERKLPAPAEPLRVDKTPTPVRPPFGGPIGGLNVAELAAFERGRDVFLRRFRPSEGLGPLYNAVSCESCHSTPQVGGSAPLYRNFYIAQVGTPAPSFLPGLPSVAVPAFGSGTTFSLEKGRLVIPPTVGASPVTVAQRNAIPIFGVGLFEFVSDLTIFNLSDPEDDNADGISGRYNTDPAGLGRLGLKSQSNNVELFTRGPLRNQMGITTNPFEGDGATVHLAFRQAGTGPNEPTTDNDGVPDPELGFFDLGDLIAFTRFLAPIPQIRPYSEPARRGEALFAQIGCVKCHVPSLPSSRGPVNAFTDLLIHDMGPGLADGIHMGVPQTSFSSPNRTFSEFRTQPLWGVSLSAPFLHDGRAETLYEAIAAHGGEAQAIRDAFVALPANQQTDLIRFLEHL